MADKTFVSLPPGKDQPQKAIKQDKLSSPNKRKPESMSGQRSSRKRCGDSRAESPVGFGHTSTPGCVLNKLFQLPTPPLSRHQLKRLEEHRYQSAGRSLLEPLMQRYWEWLVGRVPSWIAPNLITIIGLSINICTTVLLVFYCPTATEQVRNFFMPVTHIGYIAETLSLGFLGKDQIPW